MRRSSLLVILSSLVLPLAPQVHAQRAHIAPSDATIIHDTEVRSDDGEHLIFVVNRSSVPVTVFTVSLTRCENVKERCDHRRVSLKVPPGGRRVVQRVNPRIRERGFTYYFGFGWRPEPTPDEALVARANAGDEGARQQLLDRAVRPDQLLDAIRGELATPSAASNPANSVAPAFMGRAFDADTRAPLACALVALEDTAHNVVTRGRATPDGEFLLIAPVAGSYRVRIEAPGWAPMYGPFHPAADGEVKEAQYGVRFEEQLLGAIDTEVERLEHARVTAMATAPTGSLVARNPVPIERVELGGTELQPRLGIISRLEPGTHWVGIVIDSAGSVDTLRTMYPPELAGAARNHVTGVLSRIRFAPARAQGVPVCELQRLQVVLRRGA